MSVNINILIIYQRVYDDNDDGNGDDETKSSDAIEVNIDSEVLMKQAFQAGFTAMKLYYDDDDEDKLEVINA